MLTLVPDEVITIQDLAGIYMAEGKSIKACRFYSRVAQIPRTQEQYEKVQALYEKYDCQSVLSSATAAATNEGAVPSAETTFQ